MNIRTKLQEADVRMALLLGVLAFALYLPGITWGLPARDAADKLVPWGPDEIAPMGPVLQMHRLLTKGEIGLLKYPLFHYLVLAGSYAPYFAFELLTGRVANPGPGYPYGFVDPSGSIQMLLLIARGVSVLMAAGTVVLVYFMGKVLWDRTTGLLAGVFTLLMYPIFYYGKMSNVDGPAQFWSAAVLLLAAHVLREGWTIRRAVWMGVFAALAIATKDQSYAILLLPLLALLPMHARVLHDKGVTTWKAVLKAPGLGLLASLPVYALASGLAISPRAFRRHIEFSRSAWYGDTPSYWYFRYSDTLTGYWGLLREVFDSIVDLLGWPLFLVACLGILFCWKRGERSKLIFLLAIPGLLFGVILPVRHTALRFVMPLGLILACFAACAAAKLLRSRLAWARGAAWLAILAGCGFASLKAGDLVYQMRNDPRHEAARWLAGHLTTGDRLQYFESPSGRYTLRIRTFPRFPEGVSLEDAAVRLSKGQMPDADFILTMGPEDYADHWFCPAWAYAALTNGKLGYSRVASFENRSLFSHPHLTHINPRVEVFARNDRVDELQRKSSNVARD